MIVEQSKIFVKTRLEGEGSGHDWWHTLRVYNNALALALKENLHQELDMIIVELGALFHDIADHKFGYDDKDRITIISNFLSPLGLDSKKIDHVIYIANNISFKKGKNTIALKSIEAKIVQDADRLDALGAIGIARAFTYGGHKGRSIYNPTTKDDTLSHFHEKLLLLKDTLNTISGREIAEQRHHYIEEFLKQFHQEWNII